ncbi:MAG: PP2C family protein-serine/threonine phosphatase [Planctomycetota bacterium]
MAKKIRTEGRRVREMPIALKLALIMAGLVAVFMLGFGAFASAFVKDAVRQQILRAAYEAAFTAAHADLEAWGEWFGTEFQGLTREELAAQVQTMTPKEYAERYQGSAVTLRRDRNKERFTRMTGKGLRIVAVELLDPHGGEGGQGRLLAKSYSGGLQFSGLPDSHYVAERGGAVEGWMNLEGIDRHVIRGSYPVESLRGPSTVELAVYIDADAIEGATSELMAKVSVGAMGIVAIGAVVAFFAGRWLMKPLKLLQDDLRIVAGGDLEHRTQVHSGDEIGALARSVDQMTQSLAEAARLERESAQSRHQMGVAAEVATSLFPTQLPALPGYDLAGHHESSGQLGGEYYDVLRMPGGRLGLLVGSASGTGVPAAMVMAMARSFLAALSRERQDPGAVLREVNALLSGDLRRGMYVTVLLAVLDPQTGVLEIANAGHPPLLFCRGGKGVAPVHSEGIALGFDKGPVFDRTLKTVRVSLQPGDRVVLYTPGITRVTGGKGEALGEERFAALVRREAGHPAALVLRRIAATVTKFRGDAALTEDVTLLTLGRQGAVPSGGAATAESPATGPAGRPTGSSA